MRIQARCDISDIDFPEQTSQDNNVTLRTGWIIAGIAAFALLSGVAGYSQAPDAQSSASARAEAPQAPAKTDTTSAASEATAATSSASRATPKGGTPADLSSLVRVRLYRLAEGPLLIAACLLFVLGMAWRVRQLRRVTRPIADSPIPPRARFVSSGSAREDTRFLTRNMSAVRRAWFHSSRWVGRTVFGTSPVAGVVSAIFHLGLFFVPL
ncbi:MAG TPA: hypothetical protein VFI08_12130, partial [Spirochaetia bacterium]|nr:hypothetical protein [Spirochaetia bacterium]